MSEQPTTRFALNVWADGYVTKAAESVEADDTTTEEKS